jgi:hypothetical protein
MERIHTKRTARIEEFAVQGEHLRSIMFLASAIFWHSAASTRTSSLDTHPTSEVAARGSMLWWAGGRSSAKLGGGRLKDRPGRWRGQQECCAW